jgi:uncharacterized protein YndB with AHSA1/START domain
MTRVAQTVTIDRPVQEVWDYLMDSRNDAVWISNVVEVGRGGDVPVADGVEIDETLKFIGIRVPVTMTVVDHQPMTHSAVEVRGPVPGRGSYDLAPEGDGTRLTMNFDAEAHGFFKLTEPVFARMARRDIATSLANLKDLLEARP